MQMYPMKRRSRLLLPFASRLWTLVKVEKAKAQSSKGGTTSKKKVKAARPMLT